MRAGAVGGAVAVACLVITGPAAGQQGIEGQVGRFYQEDGWTVYRLGVSRPLSGTIGASVHGDHFRCARGVRSGSLGGGLI
jgi:hypothetical protein